MDQRLVRKSPGRLLKSVVPRHLGLETVESSKVWRFSYHGQHIQGWHMVNFTRYLLFIVLLVGSAANAAPGASPQSFKLPGHGELQLRVPDSWAATVSQPSENLPPTIVLKAKSGQPFQILITPVWAMGGSLPLPGLAEVKQEVGFAANEAAPQSVEGTLPLQELSGASNHGYYFKAKDRAPKVGEFKYLTQGIVRLGEINLAFTILTNDGQDSVVKAALDAMREALQVTTTA